MPSSPGATDSGSRRRTCGSTPPAPRRTPWLPGPRHSAGPSPRPSGPRSPRTPSRPPGRPGAAPRRGVHATPGSGRRSGCTDTRRGAPRDTRTTAAEASHPCAAPTPGAPAPSPAPAAEPATAPSADTAPPPAARRPGRPAAARTRPPPAPAGHSCRPCCGRSGAWPRSPGCSGQVRTSAGEHLESCAWITSSGPPSPSSLKDRSRGWKKRLPTSGHPAPLPIRSNPPTPVPGLAAMTAQNRVDEMRRNRWTLCVGISGRNESESVDGIRRNEWTKCVGISTRSAGRSRTASSSGSTDAPRRASPDQGPDDLVREAR